MYSSVISRISTMFPAGTASLPPAVPLGLNDTQGCTISGRRWSWW
jgi:hypothetical protein